VLWRAHLIIYENCIFTNLNTSASESNLPFWRKEKTNERSVKPQFDLEKYGFMNARALLNMPIVMKKGKEEI
jgi:hypothetical protein